MKGTVIRGERGDCSLTKEGERGLTINGLHADEKGRAVFGSSFFKRVITLRRGERGQCL